MNPKILREVLADEQVEAGKSSLPIHVLGNQKVGDIPGETTPDRLITSWLARNSHSKPSEQLLALVLDARPQYRALDRASRQARTQFHKVQQAHFLMPV